MITFNPGDWVTVVEGYHSGTSLQVVEVKGAVLILEGRNGEITELYPSQVRKQMLFG